MTLITDGGQAPAPFGRDPERRIVATFLERVATGPAGLLLVGPAGIGKSTIWREAVTGARRRGFRTLVTRAVEAEAELTFAGLADLLDPSFDEAAQRLPPAQRRALEIALQRIPGEGVPPPLAVSLGVLAAVRVLAEPVPVVIAVDDLPWLDGPSARVLDYVMRRVDDLRLGFLAATRTTQGTSERVTAVHLAGPVDRLEVGPLDLDAIDALLRRDLQLALPRPDLAWVHRESRGNPFFALELARALLRSGARSGLDVPALTLDTEALVQARLDALRPNARMPLAAIAAMSQPSIDLVLAACPAAGPDLAAASEAGVVEVDGVRLRFSHPLLASGAYGRLDPTERRDLHGRLSRVVADPEQRARHLALATDAPNEDVAAQLDLAAAHARGRGASDAAAELELQASRLTPPTLPDEVRRRILTAGGAFIQAGDPSRARAILEEYVTGVAPGPGRADALRVLADVRSSDDWEAKLALLDQALVEAGTDPGLRSRILEARSQARWHLLRAAGGGVEDAMEAVAEARRQDDPAVLCSALLTANFARLYIGEELDSELRDEAMRLASEVEHLRVFQWPALADAVMNASLDRIEAAIESFEGLYRRAQELGDWDSLPIIATGRAHLSFRLGRWEDALSLAREGERGSRQNGQLTGLARVLTTRAMVEIGLGNDEDAAAVIRENLDVTTRIRARICEVQLRRVMGIRAIGLGDAAAAEAELRRAGEAMLAGGYVGLFVQDVLGDWAEALIALGRSDEATRPAPRPPRGARGRTSSPRHRRCRRRRR